MVQRTATPLELQSRGRKMFGRGRAISAAVVLCGAVALAISTGCTQQRPKSNTLADLACLRTLGTFALTHFDGEAPSVPEAADLQRLAEGKACLSLRDQPLHLLVGQGTDRGVWLAVQRDESGPGWSMSELRARFCIQGSLVSATRSPSDGLALCVQTPAIAADAEAPARQLERATYPADEVDRDTVWADGYYVVRPAGLGGHTTEE